MHRHDLHSGFDSLVELACRLQLMRDKEWDCQVKDQSLNTERLGKSAKLLWALNSSHPRRLCLYCAQGLIVSQLHSVLDHTSPVSLHWSTNIRWHQLRSVCYR